MLKEIRKLRLLHFLPLLALAALDIRVGLAQQTSSAGKFQLASIQTSGLHRYKEDYILALTQLHVGQVASADDFGAASNRLIRSGLFKKVNYRYTPQGDQMVLTFQLEEMEWNVPVVFDNFVWFSDAEIVESIRAEVPDFSGLAPLSGGITETIKAVLERLLRKRNVPGQIEYIASLDASGKNPRHVFVVKGIKLPVCAIQFPGATDIPESELVKLARPVLDGDYSRSYITESALLNFLPVYHAHGHLRAEFGLPQANPEVEPKCKNGVKVLLPVKEGAIYLWKGARWSGSTVLGGDELNSALGMKTGAVANEEMIEKGFDAVREAFGKKGYLTIGVSTALNFDEAERQVTYQFQIAEGPQFHMGALSVTGLGDKDALKLKELWPLPAGATFDISYVNEFSKRAAPLIQKLRSGRSFGIARKVDRQSLTVDITLRFTHG